MPATVQFTANLMSNQYSNEIQTLLQEQCFI